MPSSATRTRLEWCPGDAALEALGLAEKMWPHMKRQEVIDRLVITGLSAVLHEPWVPPPFSGFDRHVWKLPANLRPMDSAE